MSAIRKRDTKPELAVWRFLQGKGLPYRLHAPNLPGCPDLVFPSRRSVVFVHECFWHRCPRYYSSDHIRATKSCSSGPITSPQIDVVRSEACP